MAVNMWIWPYLLPCQNLGWLVLMLCYVTGGAVEVTEGQVAHISCPAAESHNVTQVQWYQTNTSMLVAELVQNKTTSYSDKTNRMFVDTDGTLVIAAARKSDSGLYYCNFSLGPENTEVNIIKSDDVEVIVTKANMVTSLPSNTTVTTTTSSSSTTTAAMISNPFELLAVHNLTATWVGSRGANISWQDSNVQDNISYMVLVKLQGITLSKSRSMNPVCSLDLLEPYTSYTVSVTAELTGGINSPINLLKISTEQDVPEGKPRIKSVFNYTTAIFVVFVPPPKSLWNGQLMGYEFKIKDIITNIQIARVVSNSSLKAYNYTGLAPHTCYLISMCAFNRAGTSPVTQLLVWTEEGVPGPPQQVRVSNITATSVLLRWNTPAKVNGKISCYVVHYGRSENSPEYQLEAFAPIKNVTKLLPCTRYYFKVQAKTGAGKGPVQNHTIAATTDIPYPQPPDIKDVQVNASGLLVKWERPDLEAACPLYRDIHYMYKVRVRRNHSDAEIVHDYPILNSLEDTKDYQHFVTGLRHNEAYRVEVVAAVRSENNKHLYNYGRNTQWPHILMLEEPDLSNVLGLALGLLVTALLLLFAVVLFILMRRYLKHRYWSIPDDPGQLGNLPPEAFTNMKRPTKNPEECARQSIPTADFPTHVTRLHADCDLGFSDEYEEINRRSPVNTANAARDAENKHKNRYINIVAYDHSRVILRPVMGKPKSDYINANFVDGCHKQRAYIAAQGPLHCTIGDFWRMVWEQDSTIIVMITNLIEKTKKKCDQYWPERGEVQYDHLLVRHLDTYVLAHFTVRRFLLRAAKHTKKRGLHERVVIQYHYTDWPDHGVPDYTLPTLAFIRKSAAAQPECAGPIIVHCSAGVGRTGTYTVIDSMIRQINEKESINVFGFLSHIRMQRNYLVQTEDQYIFTHDALLEFIQSRQTEVAASEVAAYLTKLEAPTAVTDETLLTQQYRLLSQFQPQDYHLTAAQLPVNSPKNRSKSLVPVELARVRLPVLPGVEGSDYINASYFHGFTKCQEYIVTQHPKQETVRDFWTMVWDQNSMTIVMLSATDSQDYIEFWPTDKEEPMDCGHFKVTFTEECHQLNHVTRDFLLISAQDDYECTTRILSTTYWPETCSPAHTAADLVHTVKAWHTQHEEVEGPIIVMDRFGGCEAATFCALYTLHEQLIHEGTVDLYMVAKLYHLKRPGIFPSAESYGLLYRVIGEMCAKQEFIAKWDYNSLHLLNGPSTLPNDRTSLRLSRLSSRAESTM